jgi:H-type lectin domain
MLDLAHNPPSGARAVRANLVGWGVSKDGFRVGLETWDGGEMYAAEATWIEHKSGAKECHFGQFDTMDVVASGSSGNVETQDNSSSSTSTSTPQETTRGSEKAVSKTPTRPLLARSFSSTPHLLDLPAAGLTEASHGPDGAANTQSCSRDVSFPVIFRKPPRVICWLNRLDLPSGSRYRIRASCFAITKTRATVRLSTWGNDTANLDGAAMCWIAFPDDKKLVKSGTFGVGKWEEKEEPDRDDDSDQEEEETLLRKWKTADGEKVRGRKGRVKFNKNWFPHEPTVLVALNMLDMGGNNDLRIRTVVENVSTEGFSWSIETWVRSSPS